MATRRANTVTVLLYLADDLEGRHYPMAGVLRQLAREVAQLPDVEAADEGRRCRCGGEIVQPRTGRPRKFCTSCSPQRNSPEKGTLVETEPDRECA